MPKPTKRGNSWRCQVLIGTDENGKRIYKSITAPTKAECQYLASLAQIERDQKKLHPENRTVGDIIDSYIARSKEAISPTTLRGYQTMRRYAFARLMDMPVNKLDGKIIQDAVNAEARRVAPKTVKNEYGLLAAALKAECELTFSPKLPKIQKHIRELPPPQLVLEAITGTSIELPCLLAMWLSFSLSEIKGLRCSDVKNGYITINRVMVDVNGDAVVKDNAKVETRLRRHRLPKRIMQLIEDTPAWKEGKDGYIVDLTRSAIYHRWKRISDKQGFNMNFHDLRHMSASIMLMLGVPDKYAMERGGWSTDNIMKSVYMHTFDAARTAVDDKIDSYFDDLYKNLDINGCKNGCK